MRAIEKVEIKKLLFQIDNVYNYNAMIFRSVDGGKTFFLLWQWQILPDA